MFDPKTNKFPYPEDTGTHYLEVKKDDGTKFDETYPYFCDSKGLKFKKFWTRVLLRTIIFPLTYIRLGLRIKGKENLKKYKDVISKGVISVSNHIHMWDYLSIMNAIKPIKPSVLVWNKNVSGEMGGMVKSVGGVPLPDNTAGYMKFMRAMKDNLDNGGWIHVYAEGAMWEYYAPIRPFKKGAFSLAIRFNKPIIPMAFSYNEPNWLRKNIFKQIATLQLNIGEPIYPNYDLPKDKQEEDLTKRVHAAICKLAGIEDNIYEPIYNNSKRIDYYTDKYGIGYKGSC